MGPSASLLGNREQGGYMLGILITTARGGKTGDFIQTASRSCHKYGYVRALAIIVLHLSYVSVAMQKKSSRASFSDFFARLFPPFHPLTRRC